MACMLMSQPTAGDYIDIDTILFWLGMEFGNSRQMRVRGFRKCQYGEPYAVKGVRLGPLKLINTSFRLLVHETAKHLPTQLQMERHDND
jgi:hypothetical protein